jgi:hypothetical protein
MFILGFYHILGKQVAMLVANFTSNSQQLLTDVWQCLAGRTKIL